MATRKKAPTQDAPAPGQVAQAWAQGRLPPVVLILGVESALRQEALDGIRQAAYGEGDGGLNWVVVHADENAPETTGPAAILDEARTLPMFGADEPKIVVVRKAEALLGAKDPREIFERNLETLPAGAHLVFEVVEPGALKNTRLYKQLEAAGAVVSCEALRNKFGNESPDSPLARELAARAAARGLRLNAAGVMGMLERCGAELGLLDEELDKLALALGASPGDQAPVREEDIARICADTRLPSSFEFADALAERDARRALEALGRIFAHGLGDYRKPGRVITNEGTIVMSLLGAASYKLCKLQDVQAELSAGKREDIVFKEHRLFYDARASAQRALRRHTVKSLRAAVDALFRANLELRTGHERQDVLERLAWKACRD